MGLRATASSSSFPVWAYARARAHGPMTQVSVHFVSADRPAGHGRPARPCRYGEEGESVCSIPRWGKAVARHERGNEFRRPPASARTRPLFI